MPTEWKLTDGHYELNLCDGCFIACVDQDERHAAWRFYFVRPYAPGIEWSEYFESAEEAQKAAEREARRLIEEAAKELSE